MRRRLALLPPSERVKAGTGIYSRAGRGFRRLRSKAALLLGHFILERNPKAEDQPLRFYLSISTLIMSKVLLSETRRDYKDIAWKEEKKLTLFMRGMTSMCKISKH